MKKQEDTGKKWSRIPIITLKLLITIVLILVTGYICAHFMEYERNAADQVNKYRIDQVAQLSDGMVVEQRFKARHTHLKTVKVYFGNDYAGTAKGDVILDILEADDDEDTSGRKNDKDRRLIRMKVEISELVNNEFTYFNTDLQLKQGREYLIRLTTEDAEAGKEPLIFQRKRKQADFKGHMMVDHVKQKKYLVAKFYYPVIIYRQWAGIVASVLIILILLWFRIPLPEKLKKALGIILPLAAPLFTFWMVERFTDNGIASIAPIERGLNILVYYLFFCLLYIVFYSRKVSVSLGIAIWYVIGLANYFILQFRGIPIIPSDIMSASTGASVASNYSYSIQPVFVWNALFALLYIAVVLRCTTAKEWGWKPRLAALAVVLGCSGVLGHFVIEQKTFKSVGVKNNVWDQKKGYAKNGLFFGFVLNLNSLFQEKPENYSADAAKSIAGKYEEEYANDKEVKKKGRLETPDGSDPNVIAIMNEAFSDLSVVGDFETNKDYMPFIHSLKKNTIKGNLYMSIFGSGTCNSEFEFLTGNTMGFLQSGIIAYTQVIKDKVPNMTYLLKAQGYGGNLALHPYLASGWNRPEVYEEMGFQHFYSEADFKNPLMYRKYISDQSNYEKLEELYEAREDKDKPFYLFTVTMQNHGGFDKTYDNFENKIKITDVHQSEQANQYLSLVKKSDEAFKKLTEYFSKVDEPTIIVMFGDHQPSVETSFYESIAGKSTGDLTKEELMNKYIVPVIIWANYDIKETKIKKMSANYLSAYIMKQAGLEMSPYQKFLYKLYKKLPVLNAMGCIDKKGNYYESGLDTQYHDLVKEYQIMQYNNLIDTKHTVNSFFYLKKKKQ